MRFLDVTERMILFFPGRNMDGEVIEIQGRASRRTGIVVRFADGAEVTFTPNTWCAVPKRDATKFQKKPGRVETVGLEGVDGGVFIGKPSEGRRGRVRRPRIHQARAIRRSRRNNRYPRIDKSSIKTVVDPRSVPEIPGPPVPKPKKGSWSKKNSWTF